LLVSDWRSACRCLDCRAATLPTVEEDDATAQAGVGVGPSEDSEYRRMRGRQQHEALYEGGAQASASDAPAVEAEAPQVWHSPPGTPAEEADADVDGDVEEELDTEGDEVAFWCRLFARPDGQLIATIACNGELGLLGGLQRELGLTGMVLGPGAMRTLWMLSKWRHFVQVLPRRCGQFLDV